MEIWIESILPAPSALLPVCEEYLDFISQPYFVPEVARVFAKVSQELVIKRNLAHCP